MVYVPSMGAKAIAARKATERTIRATLLSDAEREHLRAKIGYEGSPYHKRNPGDFGLTPPAMPRRDKTLCDEAAIFERRAANELLAKAIDDGLISKATTAEGLPKQLWVIDDAGRVFEAMYGGSQTGYYHGYPIRRSDPFFEEVKRASAERRNNNE